MTEVEIRPAVPEDAAEAAEVHIAARNAYYRGLLPEERLAKRAATLREHYPTLCARTDSALLCAHRGAEIVGIALRGTPHDTELDPTVFAELYQMQVRPDHWRRGIGSLLHGRCVADWRDAGIDTAVLEVWEHNERGRAFYTAHGWRPDGHSRAGVGADDRFLRLRLAL